MTFNDNNELFDLMNKISSEISSKFDGMHFEITTMKCAISNLNNKLDKNNMLLEKANTDMECLRQNQKFLSDELIKFKSTNGESITNQKSDNLEYELSNISKALHNLDTDSSNKLTELSNDLKFITHKMQQAEKDLFNIKNKLKA